MKIIVELFSLIAHEAGDSYLLQPARITLIVLAMSICRAQTPTVSSVVRSADGGTGIPLDGFGTIYGTGLADRVYSASSVPLPTELGSTQVYLCQYATQGLDGTGCQDLPLLYASPGQINFYLPQAISGPYLTVRVNGTVDSNRGTIAAQIGQTAAPARVIEEYDCFIDSRFPKANQNCGLSWSTPPSYASGQADRAVRGAVTDTAGRLIDSANPAHLGQYISIWTTGLGPYGTTARTQVTVYNVPVVGFSGNWWEVVTTAYAGETPQYPDLFQVNVQIPLSLATGDPSGYPPPWPCSSYAWEISLGISGYYSPQAQTAVSNLVQIPVVVSQADIPGCH